VDHRLPVTARLCCTLVLAVRCTSPAASDGAMRHEMSAHSGTAVETSHTGHAGSQSTDHGGDPGPAIRFMLDTDGAMEALEALDAVVYRATGPDCTTSDTVVTLPSLTQDLRELSLGIPGAAPIATGPTVGTGNPASHSRALLAVSENGEYRAMYHAADVTLDVVGPDALQLTLLNGNICTEPRPLNRSDDPSTCPSFSKAVLSFDPVASERAFDPEPTRCTTDDLTAGGELCQHYGAYEPCP